MFEHRSEPLLSRAQFIRRFGGYALISSVMIIVSLGIGAVGYHETEGMDWLDAMYSASMILTGMGPTCDLHTSAGKIFVSIYALFSALIFLSSAGLLAGPILHRIIHSLHLEDRERSGHG